MPGSLKTSIFLILNLFFIKLAFTSQRLIAIFLIRAKDAQRGVDEQNPLVGGTMIPEEQIPVPKKASIHEN